MAVISSDKIRKFFLGNIYMVLIWRLLLILFLYSLMRVLFYLLNRPFFSDVSLDELFRIMKSGLKFDLSAIIYLNSAIILLHVLPFRFRYKKGYQHFIAIFFYIINSVGIIANMADIIYYRFTFKRTTFDVFREFGHDNPLSFVRFTLQYWYITLITIGLITSMIWIYRKCKATYPIRMKHFIYYPLCTSLMLLSIYLSAVGMRGGFTRTTRPITLSNASEAITNQSHRAIVLNTPFTLMQTINKQVLEKKTYFSKQELHTIFDANYTMAQNANTHFGLLRGRNVVLIIWESFAREWVGALNKDIPDYAGYTPFIDSLIAKSYTFKKAYANGHRSIEAMPSVLTSTPSMETPFILSLYSGNSVNSIPSLLKKEGYTSSFFHGAPNGSMGFQAFANQCGFNKYFGMNEFGKNDIKRNAWGIWDEPFLMFMEKKIDTMKHPFFATVFTLTSHDPYTLPQEYKDLFPKGKIPIHQCIGYVDHALKRFFDEASREPWFKNTLFIITADHAVNGWLKEYKNDAGRFAIPIIFYAPGSKLIGFNDSTIVQQADILPTTLSLLGYDKPFISFGVNMFNADKPHFAVNYFSGLFQLIKNNWLLQIQNDKVVGFYNLKKDRMMKHNEVKHYLKEEKEMELFLKAIIQEYNERMIDNRMTN